MRLPELQPYDYAKRLIKLYLPSIAISVFADADKVDEIRFEGAKNISILHVETLIYTWPDDISKSVNYWKCVKQFLEKMNYGDQA